jgi:hypothetical protein
VSKSAATPTPTGMKPLEFLGTAKMDIELAKVRYRMLGGKS